MKKYTILAVLIFLSACSIPQKPAEQFIQESISAKFDKEVTWWDGDRPPKEVEAKAQKLLSEPLNARRLFELALLNSYELQADLAALGEEHARTMQKALLANPELEVTAVGETQEFELTWSLTKLLSLGSRIDRAEAVFEEAQYATLEKIIARLYGTYNQWLAVIAAQQKLKIEARSLDAMEASKISTEEIHRVGNTTDLALYAAQINYSLSSVRFDLLEQNYRSNLRKLALMLSVQEDEILVPETLPKMPRQEMSFDGLQQAILASNFGLQQLERRENALHAAHTQNQTERFVHDAEVGPVYERSDGEGETGVTFGFAIPLLDTGRMKAAEIQHALRKTRLQLHFQKKKLQLTAANAIESMQLSRQVVEKLLDEVTPNQIDLETESLKSYNGMQMGIFGLLNYYKQGNDRRSGFVDMLHKYWQSRSQVEAMIAGVTLGFSNTPVLQMGQDNSEGGH